MSTNANALIEQVYEWQNRPPPGSEEAERCVIGGVLALARSKCEFAIKRVKPEDFGLALRGELWKAIQEAWRVETRWRSAAAILFAVTRSVAWKRIHASEPKIAELHACVNVNRSFYDWPYPVQRVLYLRSRRCKESRAFSDIVSAIDRLESLQRDL